MRVVPLVEIEISFAFMVLFVGFAFDKTASRLYVTNRMLSAAKEVQASISTKNKE